MSETTTNGWADHQREQRRAWLALTCRERLNWLWQAKQFAASAMQAARQRVARNARSTAG
jgi:hypothetical protein